VSGRASRVARPAGRGAALLVAGLVLAGCGGGEAPGASAAAEPGGGAGPRPESPATVDAGGADGSAPAAPELVRAPESDGEVLLVSVEEVHARLEAGAPLLLVDARGRNDYAEEHLPGAVNVPLPTIAAAGTLPGVPRDHEIVVYCIAESCPISRNAALLLGTLGYTNVKDMRAGLLGWKAAGFPTARGAR
jgi:rhodanese-related sulfurtransferase